MGKKELAALFSSDPDRYYRVSLFDKMGFERKKCVRCGKFFWSIPSTNARRSGQREHCPEHENYSFIGNPPTKKRLDYVNAWRETEEFFRANGHTIVPRYPVVCRWRDDLYFTIASIVDFQRVVGNKVVFELPANPLVVPQMCLRFNDIENVGPSGRHYTGFCMIGQTCNADAKGGYWKDRCIDLDYGMLTQGLGIQPEEITFVEDVWMGAGAFGYSLEFFVCGLELGNAVFTEFEGNENSYQVMPNRIIDMGAGLERFSWITMGTPTSYDCTFGPVIKKMLEYTGTDSDPDVLARYFSAVSSKLETSPATGEMGFDLGKVKSAIARELGISEVSMSKHVAPYEAIYTIADHVRTLVFAISDGALPSNVGGGYNLRVILRRALSIVKRMGWDHSIRLADIADSHIDYLRGIYPELYEHRQDVRTILDLETSRYTGSVERMNAIATTLLSKSAKKRTSQESQPSLTVEDLIRLYESDGITPDFLVEQNVIQSVPSLFYTKLAALHTGSAGAGAQTHKNIGGLDGLPPTRLLYYEDESIRQFSAKILAVAEGGRLVVLDQTAFYPRGGGQEPDTGEIEGIPVVEVTKQADLVVHRMGPAKQNPQAGSLKVGQVVSALVNSRRRELVTRHHTATHVLNSSARNNLGSWVWQNSAFKEQDYGRLDITHHSALTKDEVDRIEQAANKVVRQDLPVSIKTFDRGKAEQEFTFRIYQGGAVPSNIVRIVNIEGWDVEACGGTHVRSTGEIGLIKITKSERIQDGVVRMEFVAGEAAMQFIQNQDAQIAAITRTLGSSREKVLESFDKLVQEFDASKRKIKTMLKVLGPTVSASISLKAKKFGADVKLYSTFDEELDDEFHIALGEMAVEADPSIVYVALVARDQAIRVIVLAGKSARQKKIKAGEIAKRISTQLGGSGGGDEKFGQGGGKSRDKVKEALLLAEEAVRTAATSEPGSR